MKYTLAFQQKKVLLANVAVARKALCPPEKSLFLIRCCI